MNRRQNVLWNKDIKIETNRKKLQIKLQPDCEVPQLIYRQVILTVRPPNRQRVPKEKRPDPIEPPDLVNCKTNNRSVSLSFDQSVSHSQFGQSVSQSISQLL